MFSSYIKIALRNLKRNKGCSAINIFGLAVGIACCMIILFWVQDEFSYDDFHENKTEIFRVVQKWDGENGEEGQAWVPGMLGPLLKRDYPEIQKATRVLFRPPKQVSFGEKSFIHRCAVVDPSFFSIFSFPFLSGKKDAALKDPGSVVISQSMAERIFGPEDPLGQILKYDDKHVLKITGVFADVPARSHLRFDFCVPYSILPASFPQWNNNDHKVYVQLTNANAYDSISSKISGVLKDHQERSESVLALQPLREIHLYALTGVDRITYITLFSAMALIVLLIACVNFMNLATAKAARRAKEVGLRKVVGSRKNQLITQFLSESMMLAFIAMIAGLFLTLFLLPFINTLVGHEINIEFSGRLILGIVSITVLTGLAAGGYPAFFLSSFNPVRVMQGLHGSDNRRRMAFFRKTLTVIQFSVSIFFIIAAASIHRQMAFTNNRDMGIEKDDIILLDMRGELKEKYDTVKNALLRQPSISSVTSMDIPPLIAWNNTTDDVEWDGMDPNSRLSFSIKTVDYDFLNAFDAEMASGRFFSEPYMTDASDAYVINETAAKAMGLESPLGTGMSLWGVRGKIIGLVKDFNFSSLRHDISPLVLRVRPNRANYVCIRVMPGSGHMMGAIDSIKGTFTDIIPAYPFTYSFLSDEYKGMYANENLTGTITLCITSLMIIISCLGLLGLVSFMTEQKKKEIGVRKVLGASVDQIVSMLSHDFMKKIMISNVIAWPFAYYFINRWLGGFAYRIDLNFDVFVYAAILSIVLALATVSYQSVKAATADPVDSLKYE